MEIATHPVSINGKTHILGIARDITERKRAEEEIHEQAETIASIVETSQDWIWAVDLQGEHTYTNYAVDHLLGYQQDELVGKPVFDHLHEEDREIVKAEFPRWISKKQGWKDLVLRWRHKDGSLRYLESSALPTFNVNGEITGFLGVDRDITERKQAEETLS